MQNLRVCLLNDSFPPVIDGVANVVVNYATILHKMNQHVVVGTPRYPGVVDDYPFPVVRYPSFNTTKLVGYRTGNPFNSFALRELVGDGLDLIHSHCPVTATLLARSLREVADVPIIMTYHTKYDIDIAKAIKFQWLQSAAIDALVNNISAVDEVWVVSQGAGENLRKLGYQGDYRVMENGVDFPRGLAAPAQVAALRQSLGLREGLPVFLFVGRMMWYKGIRLILDALDMLHRDGKAFHMLFVGDGQDREEIEAYAGELGLDSACTFTGAIHDRELLRSYFGLSDLFVFPSTFDTNGLVVREAAACGTPSLLIRGSCAAEGVEERRSGLLCEENAGSLATALAQSMEKLDKLSEIGRRAMDELYIPWDTAVHRAHVRYEQVVENYRRRGPRHVEKPLNIFTLTADISQSLKRAEETRTEFRAKRPDAADSNEDQDESDTGPYQ